MGEGRAGARRVIGLATVTSTCGKAVCADGAVLHKAHVHENALHDAKPIFNRRRISNSSLMEMTCVPGSVCKQASIDEAVLSHRSDGVRRGARLEKEMYAARKLRRP